MSELKPLPKKITKEIRSILERCQSGKLNHNQEFKHCGTAACVAGWKESLDFAREEKGINLKTFDFGHDDLEYTDRFDVWLDDKNRILGEARYGYAQKLWGLTNAEADALFDWRATFPDQFALLEKLEAGERVK